MTFPVGTKADLLSAKPPEEWVDVPVLGRRFLVVGLMAVEKDAFEDSRMAGEGKDRKAVRDNFRAKLVSWCVREESGARMFTEAEVEALGKVRADALDPLVMAGARLSGFSDDAGKDSGSDHPGGSASSSPQS